MGDTKQTSRGKLNRVQCTTARSTLRVLDGYGLRDQLPARPTLAPRIRFLFIGSHLCSTLPSDPASRRQPLRFTIADSGEPDVFEPHALQHPIKNLPEETLVFPLGSRYCETDRLSEIAWSLFGAVPAGWERVQAIVDFVHEHITFGYEHARPTKTAWDVYVEGAGVCRDFTHLAVTLCRCMNIPARYCTGYLGDIGVPPVPAPMDFSAWFEVYLGSRWYTFDARHNRPRIGRIVIGRGLDAGDVPITMVFGQHSLLNFRV